MAELFTITSGWTGLLGPFTLGTKTSPTSALAAFNLDGYTVELVLHDGNGSTVTPGGTVTKLNQTTYPGQVTYAPVAADFVWTQGGQVKQSFKLHWKVTDGAGKIVSFPDGAPDTIGVYQL